MGYLGGFYSGPGGALPPRFASGVRLRVDNGGTYLGSITTLLQSRGFNVPTATPTSAPTPVTSVPAGVLLNPAPMPTTTAPRLSPAPAPTPTPVPGGVYSAPSGPTVFTPPPPAQTPFDSPAPLPPIQQITDTGEIVKAAAPIVGAINPAAGAAAALFPAFTDAASQGPTTQVRFTDDLTMPDAQPELYNADGTPITPAAKAATIVDKIKALPPAAKVGGAVALYLLFSRR